MTGYGLGPDLRAPVLYAMARRKASDTTFAVVYEPDAALPALRGFRETGPETCQAEMHAYTNELSFAAGKFTFTRSRGR